MLTNVLLDQAIGIILKRISDDSKLQTTLTTPELKKMSLFCKKIQFTFKERHTFKHTMLLWVHPWDLY